MNPKHRVYFTLCFMLLLLAACNSSSENSNNTKADSASNQSATDNFVAGADSEINPAQIDSVVTGGNNSYSGQQSNQPGSIVNKRKEIEKKYNSLLVFRVNDTMEVNKTYLATMALARNAALEPVKLKVLEASDAADDKVLVDTTILLGKRMRANLMDLSPRNDKSFRIEIIGASEQNLGKTKESIWQWNIEPLKEGQHKLKLSVQVILGDNDEVNLPTRDIPVTIFAQKISLIEKVGGFFSQNWQWIITAILVPVLIAFLTNRIKQKNK